MGLDFSSSVQLDMKSKGVCVLFKWLFPLHRFRFAVWEIEFARQALSGEMEGHVWGYRWILKVKLLQTCSYCSQLKEIPNACY